MSQPPNYNYESALLLGLIIANLSLVSTLSLSATEIGREVAIPRHLQDGEEFQISLKQLLDHGRDPFTALLDH